MSRVLGIRRLLHIARGRAGVERAVNDELQFHFDMTMRELMASGMTPDDARREAERRFGDLPQTRARLEKIDRARVDGERRAEWWSAFVQDLRYALRGLRLKPGFAASVILTLGLGIGANATMFGIIDQLLFRPPAFLIAPDRATRLYISGRRRGTERLQSYTGYRRFTDLKQSTRAFEAMTAFYVAKPAVGTGESTTETMVAVSDGGLWRMFDAKPVLGRFFTVEEAAPPEGSRVAVLSYAYWQTQFGGRQNAIGATIDIGSKKYVIVGVAPEGFNAFSQQPVAAFIPIAAASTNIASQTQRAWYDTYRSSWLQVFARLKPGISRAAADADITAAYQLSYTAELEENPKGQPLAVEKPRGIAGPVLADRGPNKRSDVKVATWLVGVAGIVLLIACANVANLLLARALKRRRETAVRIALGISRGRLLMQLLTESLLLAVLGGAAGVAIAQWGGAVMRSLLLSDIVAPGTLADRRVLAVSALLAIVAGLLTGLAPAFQAGRTNVAAALKAGAREGSVHRSPLRIGLLATQAALSVVLLVGAGLFVRSLVNVQNVRLGFDASQLLWVDLNFRSVKLDSSAQRNLRLQLLSRAEQVPGVESATRGLTVPFMMTWSQPLYVPGIDSVQKLGDFNLQAGTSELFQTMGTRIVRGRGITGEDRANAPLSIVVSEAMAKRIWPNDDAIGKCVRVGENTSPCRTVVGIAEDVRRGKLTEADLHYYLAIDQFRGSEGGLFVRTHGPAALVADRVRRALQQDMPGVSYVNVTPMSSIIGEETKSWKLGATMFAIFGALALVLAAIGLYSVIAYSVAQRTHEMGVRVALGAHSGDVIRLIVREGLAVVAPGVAIGALAALLAGRWIAPLLFDVSPKDPPVMVSVILTLIAVAIVASWVPALRAARVDPSVALRSD